MLSVLRGSPACLHTQYFRIQYQYHRPPFAVIAGVVLDALPNNARISCVVFFSLPLVGVGAVANGAAPPLKNIASFWPAVGDG
jgi:hypothetical protein